MKGRIEALLLDEEFWLPVSSLGDLCGYIKKRKFF